MNENFYKNLIEKSPIAYAYYKIICNSEDIPCDYEFLQVNASYERLLRIKRADILGRKATEILMGITEDNFDWIKFYGNIAINGGSEEVQQFCEHLQQWHRVKVYSPEKYYFITYIVDLHIILSTKFQNILSCK